MFKTVILNAIEAFCWKRSAAVIEGKHKMVVAGFEGEGIISLEKLFGRKDQERDEMHKMQRKKVEEVVLREKEKTWKEFGEFIEEQAKGNQKQFYNVQENTRNEKYIKCIQAKYGQIISEVKQKLQEWRDYFKVLLDRNDWNEEEKYYQKSNEDSMELQQGEGDTIEKEEMWDALDRMKLKNE